MQIQDMQTFTEAQRTQAAQMLTTELPLGWETLADAMEEIDELLNDTPDGIFLAAMAGDEVLGWCGTFPDYGGNAYELHPLVVRGDQQGKGIGTALVHAVEKHAKDKGAFIMLLGADDEKPGGETSFANVDLFDNLPKRMKNFDPGSHQAAFYMKRGYQVVGVIPDANGKGKPDILMAKAL
ncbi:MAG: GNAT family N-acetyltransferase [Defluviitaleaceae bacterium]|nr:GNAT family N-acetyltransferase [Defluviitaleaceae bacterium]